jgi:hypothetical protein
MSRLLFAAARGARVYTKLNDSPWIKALAIVKPGAVAGLQQRIHPDDAHLQYGPISTALREMAENNTWRSGFEWFLAESAANEFTEFFDSRIAEPDYPLFYLILAEALADEGL